MAASRKTYVAVANEAKYNLPKDDFIRAGYYLALTAVARGLKQDNPAFETQRFLSACGFE